MPYCPQSYLWGTAERYECSPPGALLPAGRIEELRRKESGRETGGGGSQVAVFALQSAAKRLPLPGWTTPQLISLQQDLSVCSVK